MITRGACVTTGHFDETLRFALEAARELSWPETSLAEEALSDLPPSTVLIEVGVVLPPPLQTNRLSLTRVHVGLDHALLVAAPSAAQLVRASSTALPFATKSVPAAHVSLSFLSRTDVRSTLAEAARVLVPNGLVAVTALLQGTFVELSDLLVEAAEQEDLPGLRGAVLDGKEDGPSIDALATAVSQAGLDVESRGRFELMLSFRDGAAVVQDPFVRATVLPMLLPERDAILLPPPVLSRIARAVDTYFDGQPFTLSVHVGCVRARRPQT